MPTEGRAGQYSAWNIVPDENQAITISNELLTISLQHSMIQPLLNSLTLT